MVEGLEWPRTPLADVSIPCPLEHPVVDSEVDVAATIAHPNVYVVKRPGMAAEREPASLVLGMEAVFENDQRHVHAASLPNAVDVEFRGREAQIRTALHALRIGPGHDADREIAKVATFSVVASTRRVAMQLPRKSITTRPIGGQDSAAQRCCSDGNLAARTSRRCGKPKHEGEGSQSTQHDGVTDAHQLPHIQAGHTTRSAVPLTKVRYAERCETRWSRSCFERRVTPTKRTKSTDVAKNAIA